jgi:hypothetical protein
MNAKLTWKFLERGSAVDAEIFMRTHLIAIHESTLFVGNAVLTTREDMPTATEYWLCKFNWKFEYFFLALLENSVLENLSLVSDKFHRSEPGCGPRNREWATFSRTHAQTERENPQETRLLAAPDTRRDTATTENVRATADANFDSHREIMNGRTEAAGPRLLST